MAAETQDQSNREERQKRLQALREQETAAEEARAEALNRLWQAREDAERAEDELNKVRRALIVELSSTDQNVRPAPPAEGVPTKKDAG